MSFAIRNLSVLDYANGFTAWHYKSASDTVADILAPGYFHDAGDMMGRGDFINVNAADGAAVLVVKSVSGTHYRVRVVVLSSVLFTLEVAA